MKEDFREINTKKDISPKEEKEIKEVIEDMMEKYSEHRRISNRMKSE